MLALFGFAVLGGFCLGMGEVLLALRYELKKAREEREEQEK